jgi:hypothetical protein
VEHPGAGRDQETDREQLGREQLACGPKRMLDVDSRGLAGTTMLVEKADVGGERAGEREGDTENQIDRQGDLPVGRVGQGEQLVLTPV